MGKGDLSGSPHNVGSAEETNSCRGIRIRHMSGLSTPVEMISFRNTTSVADVIHNGSTIKHRITNGIQNIYNKHLLYYEPTKCLRKRDKDKEMASPCRGYAALAIMLLANLINYMDRYTIAGVLDDVQQFYKIDYSQAGLLQTSFIISYMLLSPLFGYLGDRYNRKYIMSAGILFWSIVTFAGSFVDQNNYALFLFLRALVGVGEASYSTIAPTIIADVFSKSMRTKALSVFYFAIPFGSGLGYIVGSKVARLFGSWQWALRITPVFGVLCTVLVMAVVVEPPRGASDGGGQLHRTSVVSDLCYLLKHKSFILSSLAFTCVSFVAGALAFWAPLYMYKSMQVQGIQSADLDTVSLIFGVITCVAGVTGVLIGSYAASVLRKITPKADPLICGVGLIASAPFLYIAIVCSSHNTIATWIMIFIAETLLSLNWALVTDILLYIVVPTRRSMAEAVQILLSHALGDAGSPYLVGLMTDLIALSYGRRDVVVEFISLQYSLYMSCFVCVIGGALFLATALFIQKDREQTDRAIKEACCRSMLPSVMAETGSEPCSIVKNKLNGSGTSTISASVSASETSSEDSNSSREGVSPLLADSTLTTNSCS